MSRTKTVTALLGLVILLFGVCPKPPLSMNAVGAGSAWDQPTNTVTIHGVSTYYAPGVMQQVISNRGLDWPDGVALNRAGDLGRTVWLQWDDGTITGPLVAVDCAQEGHFETRERQGRVVEVSAELAKSRGFYGVGPHPVIVWYTEPPETRWE